MKFTFLFVLCVICSEGASVCTTENEINKNQRPSDEKIEQKQNVEDKNLIEIVSKVCTNCTLGYKNYKGVFCVLCDTRLVPRE
ncbi:hypothetical protein NBO_386g0015 [Nosema bombycis CQ1]|uniref:Uncharacterized protein n=1 Tax=Nosema bombycis (strain CQ1 / CVCC 102059) TaxID=578461 RepID=R0MIN0_NOSB1|nr:hypothetical protein NBO_386g0015 [Nosema bombycis CQ1]|eukprot:EOB12658.1 hypothetical protein NBO_386g0015 [Nosema bombycis CQ1]